MTKQKKFKHYTINPVTGKKQYYYPMEIEVDLDNYKKGTDEYETAAKFLRDIKNHKATDDDGNEVICEVGYTKLGFREYYAVYIPVSYEEYKSLIKDEMDKQEEIKQNSRCTIPAKIGEVKVCPRRIPNPDYVEGGDMPKTLAVSCDDCPYKDKKNNPQEVPVSAMTRKDDDGNDMDYEIPAPSNYGMGDRYETLVGQWAEFVRKNAPELEELAVLFAMEYLRSEAAKELNIASSTAQGQREKLKKLVVMFLENAVPMD